MAKEVGYRWLENAAVSVWFHRVLILNTVDARVWPVTSTGFKVAYARLNIHCKGKKERRR